MPQFWTGWDRLTQAQSWLWWRDLWGNFLSRNFRQDARFDQILFLSVFLALGVGVRDWTFHGATLLLNLAVCAMTQLLLSGCQAHYHNVSAQAQSRIMPKMKLWQWERLPSAVITALGLSLLLRTNNYWVTAGAAFLAIASKFLFCTRLGQAPVSGVGHTGAKHWFNPANFGIVAALLLTDQAWVANGQWGTEIWLALIFLTLGGIVLRKVGRLETSGTFFVTYGLLEALRNLWLGWTWDVWLHRLTSGSLLLFALFMITDPRAIPNAKSARILWAMLIAGLTFIFVNQFYIADGVFYALFLLSPVTILLDKLWLSPRFEWVKGAGVSMTHPFKSKAVRSGLSVLLAGAIFFGGMPSAWAFCGFYVGKADATLYNKASQVIIARNGNDTILTMSNDYQGDLKDFALVVPVPTPIKKQQVRIGNSAILSRLDAFSAPRLVEYFDPDPCMADKMAEDAAVPRPVTMSGNVALRSAAKPSRGVTIEERFSVGEYDILILSAQESDGLEGWLNENGYKMPSGASAVLQPYIRQKMKFFVAKVNLGEQAKTGSQMLRPLQIAYSSPKFMLPIRLGMLNANGDQDLLVYVLSSKGRVEVTNYRTVKIPSDQEIPTFVKSDFANFYKSMFQNSYQTSGRNVAFLEYAWDTSNCDPCSAEPLNPTELKQAGVFWVGGNTSNSSIVPPTWRRRPRPNQGVFVTRLHVRYTRDRFPSDLTFKETGNSELFQGRYILRHAFKGEATCQAATNYRQELRNRYEREAQTLAQLTSWNVGDIRRKIEFPVEPNNPNNASGNSGFWQNIWGE
ncbi:MAG: DUF2330 domain-containing protein [Pseudanabaena sp. ELA607]